jgi:hypothetical protein
MRLSRTTRAVLGLALAATGLGLVAAPALARSIAGRSALTAAPAISSITISGFPKPATPVIKVTGTGFGTRPANGVPASMLSNCKTVVKPTGEDYGKSALWLLDGSASGGLHGAWQFGANFTSTVGDCGGVTIDSWTRTRVVFKLGLAYALQRQGLKAGNTVCVSIKGVPGCLKLR